MRERLSGIRDSIREWPLIVKISVSVCIVALIAAVILVICIINVSRAVDELPTETGMPVSEASEKNRTESETGAALIVQNDEAVPSFTECEIVAESLEKDLDVYIVDTSGQRIVGTPFQLKLIPADQNGKIVAQETAGSGTNAGSSGAAESGGEGASADDSTYIILQDALNRLAEIAERETELRDRKGTEDYSEQEYEQVLIQKKNALAIYQNALNAVPDTYYLDEDTDGMIHISGLSGGNYALCFFPMENTKAEGTISMVAGEGDSDRPLYIYDCGTYGMEVTVKSRTDYQVLRYIENKVSESARDTNERHNKVKVEGTIEDTVEYLEEYSFQQHSGYTEIELDPESLKVRARVSEELREKTKKGAKRVDTPGEPGADDTEMADESKTGGAVETVEVESRLGISRKATLYANSEGSASTAELVSESEYVNEIRLTASGKLIDILEIGNTENGYRIALKKPESIAKDVEGTLTLSGMDAFGKELSVTCTVKVVGANTQLSKGKKELYIKNSQGSIVRATVGNYSASGTWYIAKTTEQVAYHGWHTEGDARYYYDKDSRLVTGKQRIGGVDYTFDRKTGKLVSASVCVDVSSWQGNIDWKQASCCVTSAIIRCGYRGTDGSLGVDSRFLGNVTRARNNGISVGLYFHSRAKNQSQAVEEASLAVALAKKTGAITLPIYIELDSDQQGSLSKAERTAIVKAFCATVSKGGYRGGVSGTPEDFSEKLDLGAAGSISVWCIQYNTECTYKGSYDIWQYTNSGRIPGITGQVDLNKRK